MSTSYRTAELLDGGQIPATDDPATLTVPKGATIVLLQAKTEDVLVSLNGSDAADEAGFVLDVASPPQEFPVRPNQVIQFEEASFEDPGVLIYQFYKTRPY